MSTRALASSPSNAALPQPPPQYHLGSPKKSSGTSVNTLASMLHAVGAKKEQQKTLAASASTPGFKMGGTSVSRPSGTTPASGVQIRPASATQAARAKVQFSRSAATGTTTPAAASRTTSQAGFHSNASSTHSTPQKQLTGSGSRSNLSILPPMSPPPIKSFGASADFRQPPSPSKLVVAEGSEADLNDLTSLDPKFLVGNQMDVNLAEGLHLLREHLVKLVPNALLKSNKYRHQVDDLLDELTRGAQRIYETSVAKNVLLAQSLDQKSSAEASEQRYRQSIANLQLSSWGNLSELENDIAQIEREIIERGSFSVEDQSSIGVGLQFGIENVSTKEEQMRKAKQMRSQGGPGVINDEGANGEEDGSTSKSVSKLVYLKFRRLEQLIYVLKRKLSVLENYPHQKEIDAKYGSIEGLMKRVEELEQENLRLETRVSGGQFLKYNEATLLKPRNLTNLPVPFLHLLIVSLQQTLQGYITRIEDSISVGREFSNTKHPLYQMVRTWSTEVEREARKHELGGKGKKKAAASVPGVLVLEGGQEKIDIDEMFERIAVSTGASLSKKTGGWNAHQEQKESPYAQQSSTGKILRASGSNAQLAAQREATASQLQAERNNELAEQLAAATLQIQSLQFENDLLQREVRNSKWIEGVLKKEGIIPNRSGLGRAPTLDHHDENEPEEQEEEEDGGIQILATSTTTNWSVHDEEKQSSEQQDDNASFDSTQSIDGSADSPRPASLDVSTAPDADEDDHPPTVIRAITITAPPRTNPASPSKARLSSVSKGLLRHLQSYSGELERYKAFVQMYQKLHVSRERTLTAEQQDKAKLEKILIALLKKYPQLQDAPGEASSSSGYGGIGSKRSSMRNSLRAGDTLSSTTTSQQGSRKVSRRNSIDANSQDGSPNPAAVLGENR